MPLPDPARVCVQAPARAGIGIGPLPKLPRTPDPGWPADWWQRNLDTIRDDPDAPDPMPMPPRYLELPEAP